MSFDEYEDARLTRENRAEEIARAYRQSYIDLTPKYYNAAELSPGWFCPWLELPERDQTFYRAVAMDMTDKRAIAPWSMVTRLEDELRGIKNAWADLSKLMKK